MKGLLRLTSAIGLVCAGAISVEARAQDGAPAAPADAAATSGADIVVTARRRQESLQSVPIAVTVLDSARLQERQVTSVTDLNAVAPSLTLSGASGRRDSPSIGIRGQIVSDTLISADPAVALYIDDVVLTPNQGINLGLYDLANVQVLKGPQGTLFGRNTTGGAVLFTTNKPTDTLGAGLTAQFGNYSKRAVTGYVNIPLSDTLSVRASGNYLSHDGYSQIVGGSQAGKQLDSEDNKSGRIIVRWSPGSVFSNTLSVAYDKADSGGTAFVLKSLDSATSIRFYNGQPVPFPPFYTLPSVFGALARQQARSVRQVEADSPIFETIRSTLVVDTTTLQLGEVQLKNIFGYRKLNYGVGYDGDDSPISLFSVNNPANVSQYTDEVQLSGTAFNGKTNWIAGFYYFSQSGSDISLNASYVGLNASTPSETGGTVNNQSVSGYLQQTSEILPRLSLTTGVRFTSDRRRARAVSYTTAAAASPNRCNATGANGAALVFNAALPYNGCYIDLEKTFSRPTWTISLDYKLSPGVLLYLANRRGYRTGGFNLRGTTSATLAPYRPEIVTDGEAGVKFSSEAFGWKIRSNAAAYVQKYTDIQRNVTFISPQTNSVTSSIINAASATIWGFEIESTIVPARGLEFNLGYSYVHPKYNSFPTASGDFSDRAFALIPKNQFNASVDYALVNTDSTGKITLSGSYNYRSGYYLSATYQTGAQVRTQGGLSPALVAQIPDVIPGSYIKGVGLFDARLSWDRIRNSRFGAALYVKNLANKTYENSGLSLYESLGLVLNTYGDPRTYGLEVSFRF